MNEMYGGPDRNAPNRRSTSLRCEDAPSSPAPNDEPVRLHTVVNTKVGPIPCTVNPGGLKELKEKVEDLTYSVNALTEENARETEAIASIGDGYNRVWKDLDTLEGRVDVLWRDVTELTAIHETEKAVNDAFEKNTKEELEQIQAKAEVAHKVALTAIACTFVNLTVLAVSVILLRGL